MNTNKFGKKKSDHDHVVLFCFVFLAPKNTMQTTENKSVEFRSPPSGHEHMKTRFFSDTGAKINKLIVLAFFFHALQIKCGFFLITKQTQNQRFFFIYQKKKLLPPPPHHKTKNKKNLQKKQIKKQKEKIKMRNACPNPNVFFFTNARNFFLGTFTTNSSC